MATVERELMEKISRLDADQQRRVLEFVRSIENIPHQKTYSPRELLRLPLEERHRIVAAALDLAADEDFEIFEAYSEEGFDDLV